MSDGNSHFLMAIGRIDGGLAVEVAVMQTRVTFVLPWPPAGLHPHAKGGKWAKIKATKSYRGWCRLLARLAKVPCDPAARIVFAFHPPARRGDVHNMPARMKPAIDGIADAMGCDDRGFRVAFPEAWADVVKGGEVVVTVETAT